MNRSYSEPARTEKKTAEKVAQALPESAFLRRNNCRQRSAISLHLAHQAVLFEIEMFFHHAEYLESEMFIQRDIFRIVGFQGNHQAAALGVSDHLV